MTAAPGQVLEPLSAPPSEPAPPKESLLERLRLLLRPSNFIAAIPGPIFQKDVWISGRKSGTYWIRGLYAALLLAVISFAFVAVADDMGNTHSASARLQQLQIVAPIATFVILWFEFVGLWLAGAIFGAPTICEEKRAGTLGTLLTTPLKAWQIVIGKTCAFFVQLMILTLIAAPLLLAVRVFGGVSAEHIFAGTALSLATALLAGLCGLYHSITVKRTPSAIMAGIATSAFLQSLFPLIGLLVVWRTRAGFIPDWLLFNFSTPVALGRVHFEAITGSGSQATTAWLISTLYTLGLCGLMIVAASFRLRGVMAREGEGGSAIPKGKKVKVKKSKGLPPAQPPATDQTRASQDAAATLTVALVTADPIDEPNEASRLPNIKRKKRRSSVQEGVSRVVGDRPVLWREMRQQVFRTKTVLIVASVFVAACVGLLYYYVGFDEEGLHITLSVIAGIMMLIAGTVTAASVISGERESRTWEVLLATPLSAWDIVLGKATGAVRRQWFVPLALLTHFAIAVPVSHAFTSDPISPAVFLWILLILVPPVMFLSATGTLFSLLCRKSATAAASNLGLAILLWAGTPALLGWFLFVLLGEPSWSEEFFSVVMIANPMGMIVVGVEGATNTRGYELYALDRVSGDLFFVAAAACAAVYLLGTYLALKLASSILARDTARAR